MGKFYLTTTIPYVNAEPHIGNTLEFIQADVYARYRRIIGDGVIFSTGTDEHGQKIYQKAIENNEEPQAYVDRFADKVREVTKVLGLSNDRFIRTTDQAHKAAAQEFWKRCEAAGDIYKKQYQIKYCVGCELEKTDSELEHGKCPLHPTLEIQNIDEENYFFRLSKYQDQLLAFYKSNEQFLIPRFRINEMISLIEREGLTDFSISRLKSKMPWGVPVPGDEDQVMFVWFDALVNYISTLGWPKDEATFDAYWPGVQFAGKDQVRQQAVMWQAMLLSAKLPMTKQIFIHGFLSIDGQRISKSLGNVISPFDLVEKYGQDAARYLMLRHVNPYEDTDVSWEKFTEWYNADLANGLGNVASRIMKMAEDNLPEPFVNNTSRELPPDLTDLMNRFEFNKAMDLIWGDKDSDEPWGIQYLDKRINNIEPFKLVKLNPEEGKKEIKFLVAGLYRTAEYLEPFMPDTSVKIKEAILANKKPESLFKRID